MTLTSGPTHRTSPHPGPDGPVPAAPRAHLAATARADEALPLPTSAWGAPDAVAALVEAADELGLDLGGPGAPPVTVVSALTTVVLRAGAWAVKVYPPGTDPEHLARTRRALAGSRTALVPVAGPVVTPCGVVAASPWLEQARPAGWAETGALLRRFHEDHDDADVPDWDPLRRVVTQVVGLPDEAAAVLLAARTTLLGLLAELHSPLGIGTVHGDLSPSNVVRTATGAVLIDLDFVAHAPREYDLTSAARRVDAGEIDAATYRDFCEAYGFDVRSWPGRAVLDRVADLGGVAFRLWDDRRHGRPLDWVAREVAYWRPLV